MEEDDNPNTLAKGFKGKCVDDVDKFFSDLVENRSDVFCWNRVEAKEVVGSILDKIPLSLCEIKDVENDWELDEEEIKSALEQIGREGEESMEFSIKFPSGEVRILSIIRWSTAIGVEMGTGWTVSWDMSWGVTNVS